MNNSGFVATSGKSAWVKPSLQKLDLGLENVEFGVDNGTDGAGGFSATSLS